MARRGYGAGTFEHALTAQPRGLCLATSWTFPGGQELFDLGRVVCVELLSGDSSRVPDLLILTGEALLTLNCPEVLLALADATMVKLDKDDPRRETMEGIRKRSCERRAKKIYVLTFQ